MPLYRSCHSVEGELFFNHLNKIGYCSMLTPSGGQPTLFENYNGEIIDWEEFFKNRDEHIELMKTGSELPACKNCLWIREYDWAERKKEFRYILLNIWVKCNFKCIYCSNHTDMNVLTNTKPYNIIPVLKDMIEKGYITKDTKIDIAGGESTLDPYFNELMHLLIDNGIRNININTNASNYVQGIERGINAGYVSVITSVDAGNRKNFKRIKTLDLYNKVWENIKKYSNAVNIGNNNTVRAKYIVIPDINDTKKELKDFILKAKKSGVQGVIYSVDLHWVRNNPEDSKTMLKIIKLADYFIKICTILDIDWQVWAHVEDLIKRYNIVEKEHPVDLAFIYNKDLYKNKKYPFLKFTLDTEYKFTK